MNASYEGWLRQWVNEPLKNAAVGAPPRKFFCGKTFFTARRKKGGWASKDGPIEKHSGLYLLKRRRDDITY
jgi:hypothetical protein